MRVSEIAAARGQGEQETALDLIVESLDQASAVYHVLDEEGLRRVLALPWVMIGSDGCARAIEGPTAVGRPHPRSFGTFARVLGHYARDQRVLSLEEAVQKMTSLPADRIGCPHLGRIAVGARADLVAFDPDRVRDVSSFEQPFAYSEGFEHLWIGGRAVLEAGRHTGQLVGAPELPGRHAHG
jgi:N-acyl-D-aspartate/D-glutamate deacylase